MPVALPKVGTETPCCLPKFGTEMLIVAPLMSGGKETAVALSKY
jgi:hypothetical protein